MKQELVVDLYIIKIYKVSKRNGANSQGALLRFSEHGADEVVNCKDSPRVKMLTSKWVMKMFFNRYFRAKWNVRGYK